MDQNYISPKTSHPGRAFLGAFLTFIIFTLLISNGYLLALKTTVFKGDDVNDILESCDFYDTMQSAVINELYENADSLGISRDAIASIFPDDVIRNAAETITDAVTNDREVDLAYLKDDCMDVAKDASETVIDTVFDGFEQSSKVIDASSLANDATINKFESDYGINITDTIVSELDATLGATSVDLSSVDAKAARQAASEAITQKIYPAIDNAFDKYVSEANHLINKSISTMNDQYDMSRIFKLVEDSLAGLTIAIIVIFIIITALFLIELLIYKTSLHRPFRNFSIGALLAGIIIFLSGMIIKFLKDMLFDKIFDSFDSTEIIIKEFIENNVASVNNMIIAIGVVYIVIFLIFMAIASSLKKKNPQL